MRSKKKRIDPNNLKDCSSPEAKEEIREFFEKTLPNMTPAERAAGNERLRKAADIYRSGDKKAIARLERSIR